LEFCPCRIGERTFRQSETTWLADGRKAQAEESLLIEEAHLFQSR
jgi:hypothetical protein